VALAALLRLGYVLLYPQSPALMGDDRSYDDAAWNLARGEGFAEAVGKPEITIGPGYPALLAAVYLLAGHNISAARMAQALLGAGTVLLCYLLGREVFDRAVGQATALLVAVNPALIIYTGMLFTETVFAFVLVFAVWLTVRAAKTQALLPWLLGGAIVGLAALVRAEALAMVPLLAILGWVFGARELRVRNLAIFLLALAIVVGVWTARNYLVFGEPVLVSANAGRTLWISTTGFSEWPRQDPTLNSLVAGLDPVQSDRVLFREGVKKILSDPVGYLRLCVRRIVPFWVSSHTTYLAGFSDSFSVYSAEGAVGRVAFKLLLLLIHLGLLATAVLGLVHGLHSSAQRTPLVFFALAPTAAIAGLHFFLFATARYQVPILPLVLLFSAVGLRAVITRSGAASRAIE
jgi:4-amino-4-deoxy-L-arabinose transferase-like glycosyltransferase